MTSSSCVSRDRRNPTHGGAQMYLGHWVIPDISIKHPPAQDRKMSMLRFCASGWLVDPSPENRPQNSNICHVLLEIRHLWAECWVLHPQLVNVQHDASDKSRCHLGGGVCGLLRAVFPNEVLDLESLSTVNPYKPTLKPMNSWLIPWKTRETTWARLGAVQGTTLELEGLHGFLDRL